MGIMLQNLCAMSVMIGCNQALDTFVSQAAGAGNYEKCGLYLNKARLITVCLFIPVSLVLCNSQALLVALG